MKSNILVLDTLSAMQRHADCVRKGKRFVTQGTVVLSKAMRLARRFDALYDVNVHRNTRSRRARRGEASGILIFYRLPRSDLNADAIDSDESDLRIGWSLLFSEGFTPALHAEKLRDALDPKTCLRIGPYDLVRRPRKGSPQPAFTFRMNKEYYERYRDRVIRSARGDMSETPSSLLRSLYSEPGFAAIRSQVGHIVALWRREFRRRQHGSVRFPALPKLRYVQRLRMSATPLTDLIGAVTKNCLRP